MSIWTSKYEQRRAVEMQNPWSLIKALTCVSEKRLSSHETYCLAHTAELRPIILQALSIEISLRFSELSNPRDVKIVSFKYWYQIVSSFSLISKDVMEDVSCH